MANNIVRLPIDYFPDPTKGRPVFNGSIYIGNQDTDPEILGNRKTVALRQEDGTEVTVTGAGQPLITGAGGVILYNGSPVQALTSGNYSIKVLNSQGSQVYYVENVDTTATGINYNQGGASSVDRTVESRLQDKTSVYDSGAIGDGISNDSAALLAALTDNKIAFIPKNTTCLIESNLSIPSEDCTIVGEDFSSMIKFTGDNRRISATFGGLTLRNLMIDGQKPSVGYETTNNTDYGVNIGEGVGSTIFDFVFDGVKFKDIGLDGIRMQNCSRVRVEDNCVFENCRRWGVTVIPDTQNQDDIYIGGHYDCSNGTGPAGKEFPLGSVDTEPNGAHPTVPITNVRYGKIYSNKGEVSALDTQNDTLDVTMLGVHVEDNLLRITNNKFSLNDVTISGDEGYLRIDTADSIATELRDINARFINTGRTETFLTGADKRSNFFRADYGDASAFGIAAGVSGTGSVTQEAINIDGRDVYATKMSLTAGAGNAVLTQTANANINAGDQVFMYLEVDRTDGNTSVTPHFNAKVGAAGEIFTIQKLLGQGITRMCYAINAPANIVTPSVSFGLTATETVSVDVVVRKCFLFVNPELISNARLVARPYTVSGNYTGTGTGFSSNPSGPVAYTRDGNTVTVSIASGVFTGTSNAATFTITGAPATIRPSASRVGFGRGVNNGAGLANPISLEMATNGTITLSSDSAGGVWTASSTKALSNTTFSYNIE